MPQGRAHSEPGLVWTRGNSSGTPWLHCPPGSFQGPLPWPLGAVAGCHCHLASLACAHLALTLAQAVTHVSHWSLTWQSPFSLAGSPALLAPSTWCCLHPQQTCGHVDAQVTEEEKNKIILLDEIPEYLPLCIKRHLLQKTNKI